jgi:hypothetical protein
MKKFTILLAVLAATTSMPAFAGPNWLVIHDERRDTLQQDEHCSKMGHLASLHKQAAMAKHKSMLSSGESHTIHS